MDDDAPEAEGQADESVWTASDADLESILQSGALPEETDEDSEPEAEDTENQEGEALADDGDEEAKEASKPEYATRDDLQKLNELLSKQGRQLDGQELLLQRRASDLADVKQRLAQFIEQAEAAEDDLSPADAARLAIDVDKARQQIRAAEGEEHQIARIATNQEAVRTFVDDREWDIEANLIILDRDAKAKGTELPRGFAEAYRANPFAHGSADGQVHLAKRAFAEKVAMQVFEVAKSWKERAIAAEAKLTRRKPEQVINGLNKALNKPIPLNGRSAGSVKTTTKPGKVIDPWTATDEELDALLSQTRK